MPSPSYISQLLLDWSRGDQEAPGRLMPLVYTELHRLAEFYMRNERRDHTLQPTALIHEAYLRLLDSRPVDWKGRAHFFGVAAKLMRDILVDHARKHNAIKRGGFTHKLTLGDAVDVPNKTEVDLMALDEAWISLEALNPEWSRIVELRFFGGLSNEEIAEVMGISIPTIVRHWRAAKAWLYRELNQRNSHDS